VTDFDPTDPWGERSPWEIAQPNTDQPANQEAPVTTPAVAANPNPFKIGLTLKAGAGYDAEWITPTIYGATADEVAQRTVELINALKKHGVIELTAKAAEFARSQGGGDKPAAPASKPSFQNGRVQYEQSSGPERPDNVPADYTYREGTGKNGKPYKGWFPPRGSNASPIWV